MDPDHARMSSKVKSLALVNYAFEPFGETRGEKHSWFISQFESLKHFLPLVHSMHKDLETKRDDKSLMTAGKSRGTISISSFDYRKDMQQYSNNVASKYMSSFRNYQQFEDPDFTAPTVMLAYVKVGGVSLQWQGFNTTPQRTFYPFCFACDCGFSICFES
jgi:hypothetical protein